MSNKDYTIRNERPEEYRQVEELTREAFWNVYRPGCLEHYVLHTLRDDPAFVPELSLVLEKDGQIIGHVMYMRAHIETKEGAVIPMMTFGPISIAPDLQRQGYGKLLLDESLKRAKEMGAGVICMEGNINFYGKSGFVVASTRGIHYNDEPWQEELSFFLLKELEDGFLDGVEGTYRTPQGYYVDEQQADAFDKLFTPKEKLKLPTQLF